MSDYQFMRSSESNLSRCETCHALVFGGDEEAHGQWHERVREAISNSSAGFAGMFANREIESSI